MRLFHFEHHSKAVATPTTFVARLANNILFAILVIAVALAIGMIGYHAIAGLGWVDAFLNAAMLLGGMGPVNMLDSDAAKIFAGVYALMCGLLVVLLTGVILAPILHRVLHALHAQSED